MITFHKLLIRDFKSIKEAELEYTAGVWKVIGINHDATFRSNGSGKTTLLEAIQQCLFNKTTSPTPIEDTSRKTLDTKTSERGYRLELFFDNGEDDYRIVNDRKAMTIKIFKNDMDIMCRSIPTSLSVITEIIGMDFHTFKTLTFISHDTIVDLLDNFSSSGLMKIILNFSQISDFEKKSRAKERVLTTMVSSLTSQIQTINDSLDVLTQFSRIDLRPLSNKRVGLEAKLLKLRKTEKGVLALEKAQRKAGDLVDESTVRIHELKHKFTNATCPTCGARLDITENELEKIMHDIEALEVTHGQLVPAHAEALDVALEARETYSTAYSEIASEIDGIAQQVIVAKAKNEMYDKSKKQSDKMRENLINLEAEHEEASYELVVLQTARKVIKSGEIQHNLLTSFVSALNTYLIQFKGFVSLDYIGIIAEATKDSVGFKIHDARFNQAISIHTLSGGEKTRLRLVVLLAMLHTIKELASVSTNLLVFDESLDTLDASATEDLANLFAYLVNVDSKFIALISHGAQLEAIDLTGIIKAEKTNGISEITKEVS